VLTEPIRTYDFVKMELDQRYNRAAGTIKNTSAVAIAAGASLIGLPVKLNGSQWETVQNPHESQATGFIVDEKPSEAIAAAGTSTLKYQILVRGPALVNRTKIRATDVAGTAFVTATLVTRLESLSPPVFTLIEPATVQTQTT
jgi:hypothetical protein